MDANLVVTITGPDRIGFVERVSQLVAECRGNIAASRMARLGGEFAMLMYITISSQKLDNLNQRLDVLSKEGYKLTSAATGQGDTQKYAGWMPYQIEVTGADHEGIIHHITRYFADNGFNIENMDTNMVKAPVSGIPLFQMSAVVLLPPDQLAQSWHKDLKSVADEQNVDIKITHFKG
jgi:glycine cleavage system transcriptional repressor